MNRLWLPGEDEQRKRNESDGKRLAINGNPEVIKRGVQILAGNLNAMAQVAGQGGAANAVQIFDDLQPSVSIPIVGGLCAAIMMAKAARNNAFEFVLRTVVNPEGKLSFALHLAHRDLSEEEAADVLNMLAEQEREANAPPPDANHNGVSPHKDPEESAHDKQF